MKSKIRIGIIGATGYVGMELVRGLYGHPGFVLSALTSKSFTGKKFSDVYPAFRNIVDIPLTNPNPDELSKTCDLVITALPHGVSSVMVPLLLEKGLKVLDHSGDFRYKDVTVYEKSYVLKHPSPELLSRAVYGLPELNRTQLKSASLVSNPGCYPTCSILALKPLLEHHLVDPSSIIIDATSGVSGAGRKADLSYSFCEAESTYRAYSPTGHRHTSEIEQILSEISGIKMNVTFTPHLAPMKRGMHATVYASLQAPITAKALHDLYAQAYQNEYFIRVLPVGICPDTRNVIYTNFADISVFIDEHTNRAIILCAIDNLGKGAALQAVQSLNCMFNMPETSGLIQTGGGI